MFQWLRKIKNPAIYQGKRKMKGYFEGWYYKIVDEIEDSIYAIIPGVSFDEKGKAHAFIQFFDGKKAKMKYFQYDYSSFNFNKTEFGIRIGKNTFSYESIKLDINMKGQEIKGELKLKNIKPWPVKLLEPGAMGIYRYIPKMECYHAVLSFDHILEGTITIDGDEIDFTNGKGYMEKDYGTSFPYYYIWTQSNHWIDKQNTESDGTSLMISFAKIPWFRSAFDGFIVGFLYNDKLYKFTTYNGAKIKQLELHKDEIIISLKKENYLLEANAKKDKLTSLASPIKGSMTGRILESITATLKLKLTNEVNGNKQVIFEGKGRNAGLDLGGKIDQIKQVIG